MTNPDDANRKFALVVRFTTKDLVAAEQFDALVERTLESIREEPGTLIYAVHTPESEPLVRVFYELYDNRAAFEAHEAQAHTKRMLAEREQYLTNIQVTFMYATASKRPVTPA